MNPRILACFLLQAIAMPVTQAAPPGSDGPYVMESTIPGRASLWDYAAVDTETGRLYLASNGVMALDLTTRQVSPQLVPGTMTHGIVPLPKGLVAVADATAHAVELFDGVTGRVVSTIQTGKAPTSNGWHNPDALVWEPQTGVLIAVNGDSGSLVIIDTKTAVAIATIAIGGKLEFAAADGKGIVYVNIETKNAIAMVDIPKRTVIKEIKLAGCEEPSGLAYDANDRLVLSVCANGRVKIMAAGSGLEVASLKVGKGADAIFYDPIRHFAFSTSGDDGTLSVIAVRSAHDIHVVQTLKTSPGARLGAVDPTTGHVYIPAVQYDPALPPIELPGLPPLPAGVPDSFRFLIFAPRP